MWGRPVKAVKPPLGRVKTPLCHICHVQCRAAAGQTSQAAASPLFGGGWEERDGWEILTSIPTFCMNRGNGEYIVLRHYNSITLGIRHGDGGEWVTQGVWGGCFVVVRRSFLIGLVG